MPYTEQDLSREEALYAMLVARSWSDAEFRQRVIDYPREVLAEYGWPVPEPMQITVNTSSSVMSVSIPLPPKPDGLDADAINSALSAVMGFCC